jgi:hypothetical protein
VNVETNFHPRARANTLRSHRPCRPCDAAPYRIRTDKSLTATCSRGTPVDHKTKHLLVRSSVVIIRATMHHQSALAQSIQSEAQAFAIAYAENWDTPDASSLEHYTTVATKAGRYYAPGCVITTSSEKTILEVSFATRTSQSHPPPSDILIRHPKRPRPSSPKKCAKALPPDSAAT